MVDDLALPDAAVEESVERESRTAERWRPRLGTAAGVGVTFAWTAANNEMARDVPENLAEKAICLHDALDVVGVSAGHRRAVERDVVVDALHRLHVCTHAFVRAQVCVCVRARHGISVNIARMCHSMQLLHTQRATGAG